MLLILVSVCPGQLTCTWLGGLRCDFQPMFQDPQIQYLAGGSSFSDLQCGHPISQQAIKRLQLPTIEQCCSQSICLLRAFPGGPTRLLCKPVGHQWKALVSELVAVMAKVPATCEGVNGCHRKRDAACRHSQQVVAPGVVLWCFPARIFAVLRNAYHHSLSTNGFSSVSTPLVRVAGSPLFVVPVCLPKLVPAGSAAASLLHSRGSIEVCRQAHVTFVWFDFQSSPKVI